MEEIGLVWRRRLRHRPAARRSFGYVYDQAAPIGDVITGAPTAQELALTFVGQAAHAGMYPEEGRSAIVAAARAIADMPRRTARRGDDGQRRGHQRWHGAATSYRALHDPGGGAVAPGIAA